MRDEGLERGCGARRAASPARPLGEAAEEEGAALLVVGSTHRGQLGRRVSPSPWSRPRSTSPTAPGHRGAVALGQVTRRALRDVADDLGAELIRGRVVEVLGERRAVRLEGGRELTYDVLVHAVGARSEAVTHAITFGLEPTDGQLRRLVAGLETGYAALVGFGVAGGLAIVAVLTCSRHGGHGSRPPDAGEAGGVGAREQ